jgi:hypothetical protein
MTNEQLADRARQIVRQFQPRTPERRAAAACWAALTTTKTTAAARRALGTFGDPPIRAEAMRLLGQLEQETTR